MSQLSMNLCATCKGIFTGLQLLRQEQPHHELREHYLVAARLGCYICGIIVRSVQWQAIDPAAPFKSVWYLSPLLNRPTGWLKLAIDSAWEDVDDDTVSFSSEEALALHDAAVRPDFCGPEGLADAFVMPKPPIWSFLLQPAADVHINVGDYDPPIGLESPTMLDIAVHWLSECQTKHSACGAKNPGFYPTRLIEIMTDDAVRVVLTQEQPPKGAYASLSHCWGRSKALKLLQSNIEQLKVDIKIIDLPTSYREAITVCRRFQFRYIWIDSLCIIQDSYEDWKREATTMKDVYQNSIMNIAMAAAADNSEASFESRDLGLLRPLNIEAEWEGLCKSEYYLQDEDMYDNEMNDCPLRRRAWVIQEVFLTPRSLNLTKSQLWWECRELEACEAYPNGLPSAWSGTAQNGLPGKFHDVADACDRWDRLVETYSECQLTVLQDKMVAFSGLAQHFQDFLQGDRYIAGLWRSQLPQSLFWQSRHIRPCYRPTTYRAPSWSWASIEGPVNFESNREFVHGDIRSLCTILDITTFTDDHTETGPLSGGYIRVRGRLTQVGKLNDGISVQLPDGSWDYIKGSDEERRGGYTDSWSFFHCDECSSNGEVMFSYLDGLDAECCSGGRVDRAARVTKHWATWDGSFFALPIVEFHKEDKKVRGGLILCRFQEWPVHIYQRVGSFTAVGGITIGELEKRSVEKTIMIL
ncbi:heterokaryon incompatibility protein-domain-containing protein [Hypoxylon rubiginosum]|uniref:Heterokaryon incompatibility protein-domain-containing protein n=1 Tax=Hypoxylon rubiginosum TaxID=110542 RepID=A0ACB9YW10_9PEZI|nr:heterokaryon incompatibility protein-domain-containing protein [Hypoxylon rubiginosum]